jgi:Uma2 family endonuclease
LCIEILSPDDRLTAVLSKCDEYLDWGVPMTWILDPENRVAYEYPATRVLHEIPAGSSLTAGPIAIPISRLFAGLESEAG